MRTFSGILFSLLLMACATTVTRAPRTHLKLQLPSSPDTDGPWQVPLENAQDLQMVLAGAHLQGNQWPAEERTRVEAWVLREIGAQLKKQRVQEAVAPWAALAEWHTRVQVKPSPEFLQVTLQLLDRFARAGAVAQTLQIMNFLDHTAPDKLARRDALLAGMIELERVRIEHCRFENQQQKELCLSQGTLEREAYQGLSPWAGAEDLDTLKRISFTLWQVPPQTPFASIPEWIVQNAPPESRLHEADRWFALCLFENGCFRKPPAEALKAMEKLNSYVHEAWKNLISDTPSPAMLESLSAYMYELGPAFGLRMCEQGSAIFPGHPRVPLCRNRALQRMELSLVRRNMLVEQIRSTPDVRELWEELFQVTVQRFFHFAEREQLEPANREYAYMEQLVLWMEARWPSSEHRNSLVVQTLAISELHMLRGQVDKVRAICQKAFESTQDPRLLQTLFRLEFWSGNYAAAVEVMKKLEGMTQNSVQNQYLYLRQTRYHALALEQLGEPEAAAQLRMQAVTFFRKLFDFVSDPDLRTELVMLIAELYFDAGNGEIGLQLFQAALTRSPSCDILSQILKTLVIHERVDAAFDVYHTLMDNDACPANRKLYTSIWMRFFGLRNTITDERMENVHEFLNTYEGESWLAHLAAFARGKSTLKQLLAKAGNVGQKAEALYYGGLAAWAGGDSAMAFDLFRQVLDLRILNYTEHEFAFWHFEMQKRAPKLSPLPDLSQDAPAPEPADEGDSEGKDEAP